MLLSPKTASGMITSVVVTTIFLEKISWEDYIALYHEKVKIANIDQSDNSYNEYKIES